MGRDALTGLGDRREFLSLARLPGAGWTTLAVIDLDGLTSFNDEHGHPAGDRAIVDVVERLLGGLSSGARVFRIGGDEFAALAREPLDEIGAVLASLATLPHTGGLTFSVGVTAVTTPLDVDEALSRADAALWFAKAQGRARVEAHSPATEQFVADRRDMFDQLRVFQAAVAQLHQEAHTDARTGIGNVRALDRQVTLAEQHNPAQQWAVIFVDIDEFHDYNHRHGQAAGDLTLRLVAQVLSSTVRAEDTVTSRPAADAFRQGGEEFVAIVAVSDPTSALLLGQRLRTSVEDLRLPHGAPGRPFVTVSVGVALSGPGITVDEAVEVAAKRAYWLKEHHRRNEVLAEDESA